MYSNGQINMINKKDVNYTKLFEWVSDSDIFNTIETSLSGRTCISLEHKHNTQLLYLVSSASPKEIVI